MCVSSNHWLVPGEILSSEGRPYKEECSWLISKYLLFPSLCQMHKWIFRWSSLWEPGKAAGGKTHKSVEYPYGWASLEFFNSQTHSHRACSSSSMAAWVFLPQCWFLQRILPRASASAPCDSVSARLSLAFERQQFALWLQFSKVLKNSCQF